MAKNTDNGVIEGVLTMTAKAGEKTQKGFTRKRNVYQTDFGQIAMEGELFGKLPGEKYIITLTPVK
jgi:hypothetical protein